jgi:hypothetical protein
MSDENTSLDKTCEYIPRSVDIFNFWNPQFLPSWLSLNVVFRGVEFAVIFPISPLTGRRTRQGVSGTVPGSAVYQLAHLLDPPPTASDLEPYVPQVLAQYR